MGKSAIHSSSAIMAESVLVRSQSQ